MAVATKPVALINDIITADEMRNEIEAEDRTVSPIDAMRQRTKRQRDRRRQLDLLVAGVCRGWLR